MDWASFAAGALSATFLLTLARVVRALGEQPTAVGHAAPTPEPGPRLVEAELASPLPTRPASAPLAFLEGLPAEVVAGRLMREHPLLAAYVLDHLAGPTRERVLALMGEGPRQEVLGLLSREEPIKISGEAFVELIGRLRAPNAP